MRLTQRLRQLVGRAMGYGNEAERQVGERCAEGWYLGDGAYAEGDGPEHMWYREGDHVLGIEWYYAWDLGGHAKYVYSDDWDHWRPPHDDEPISEDKRLEIARRLTNYKWGPVINLFSRPEDKRWR